MAYQYPNKQIFQNGLHITAAEPIDDRSYVPSLNSLFIKGGQTAGESHILYNKMYAGHMVVVTDSNLLMILKDPAPYMRDTSAGLEVNADNYMTYWEVIGYQSEQDIETNVKPRVSKLESYSSAVNVSDGNTGAIEVTNTPNANGYQQYVIKVKVDNDTVKIGTNDTLNVGKYKLVDIGGTDDEILTKYQLWYKAPNSTEYVALGDSATINIQKDYVLKEVHLCKASYNSSTKTYTETSRPGDPNWETDTNDVYLHFIWNTQNGTGHQTETFLKVEDVIGSDVAQMRADILDISAVKIPALNNRIADVSQNLNDASAHINAHINSSYIETKNLINDTSAHINSHIDSSYVEIKNLINDASAHINAHINSSYVETKNLINDTSAHINSHIDSSYGEVKERLDLIDSSIKNGEMMYTSAIADNVEILTDHGEIKAGTTAAELKEMTLSEVFDLLLFETAVPNHQNDASATIAWKSTSPYKNTVDMGVDIPAASATIIAQVNVTFTPERWKWSSKDDSKSKTFDVVTSNGTTCFYAATSTGAGSSTGTTVRLTDAAPTGYFYGEVALKAGTDAKDSLGNATDKNGAYYAKATDRLATYTGQKVTTTSRVSTTAAWRVFSNATKLFTSSDAAYTGRNTNPGTYKGSADANITQNDVFVPVAAGTVSVFLQWPATTETQPLYVCVPNTANCKCTITGAYAPALAPSAATDEGRFPSTGTTNYLKSGSSAINRTSTISGTGLSGQGQEGSFLKYEIKPLAGISTLRIIIKRS